MLQAAGRILLFLPWLVACADDAREGADAPAPDTHDGSPAGETDASDGDLLAPPPDAPSTPDAPAPETTPPEIDDSPLGGDRPARVVLPNDYHPADPPRPLLVLLHGYSASGEIQDLYLGLSPRAAERGFITLLPDGTKDGTGLRFWNASPGWCCDFGQSGVDDAGYLLALIAEAKGRYAIDPARVYLVGHSNGGFMSYKLACENAGAFAAVAAIAASMPLDEADCAPTEPVSILHVHGTADATIFYPGVPDRYPSAETTALRWAAHADCERLPSPAPTRDYDNAVIGAETHPLPYPGCAAGHAVELWELRASGHVPAFSDTFIPAVLDWLLAHPNP